MEAFQGSVRTSGSCAPNTGHMLGLFIDTRGENGYVIELPSQNKHGAYAWEVKNPIAPITPQLLAWLQEILQPGHFL